MNFYHPNFQLLYLIFELGMQMNFFLTKIKILIGFNFLNKKANFKIF